VLSAHSETKYLLELVNLGISQFIPKPLEYEIFIHVFYSKLKELHDNSENSSQMYKTIVVINKELIWNKETKQILLNNENIKLTKKEILLIDLLLKYIEQTHTVEEILNHLWFDDEINTPDIVNLKNIISRLRKKLPMLDIENVYSFGYRINLK
jgi:DNA-binding response OmpR family regulator